VVAGGKLYLIGGAYGSHSIREYDPVQDAWSNRAYLPGDGYGIGHTAAVVGGRIWVIGGLLGYPVRSYDPASDQWASDMRHSTRAPHARVGGHRQ
jgi:hypothetical protein